MLLLKRLVPIVTPLCLTLMYESLLWYPEYILYFWLGMLLIIASSLIFISKKELGIVRISFLISLLFFNSGAYYFIFFISGELIRQIIIAAALIFNLITLTQIFYYYFRTEKYQVNALQNISSYLNLISVFNLTGAFFSLIVYLTWPAWLLSIFVFVVITVLSLQTMWVNKIQFKSAWRFSVISGLVGFEIFWATSFLPSSFLVNALIITVVYYAMVNLGRYYYIEKLNKSVVIRYLVISASVLLLTVATARWI